MILEDLLEIEFDAAQADVCSDVLRQVMAGLEARDWPRRFRDLTGPQVFQALADAASQSGAVAFLLLQGFVAGNLMSPGDSSRVGVAFGHLRDPSKVRVYEQGGTLTGVVPWLSGAGWFEEAMLGWVDSEGCECVGRVAAESRPEFLPGEVMPLIALRSTSTVSVQVEGLPAPEPIKRSPLGTMAEGDLCGAVWQTPLMFGIIAAARREIEACGEDSPRLAEAVDKLRGEADRAIIHGVSPTMAAAIRTRAARLAVEAARRSVVAARGAGILLGSEPERIVREALVIGQMAMTAPLRLRALNEAAR